MKGTLFLENVGESCGGNSVMSVQIKYKIIHIVTYKEIFNFTIQQNRAMLAPNRDLRRQTNCFRIVFEKGIYG